MTPVNIGDRSSPERMMSWVRLLVCAIQQGHLARMLVAIAEEGKHRHRIVPGLFLQQGIIDAAAVEPRRRAGS
jgi:hypothetical protein